MTAFAGVRGTGEWGTDERPKNFRHGLLRLNPNGTAPIYALTDKMEKESLDDPETSWWAQPNDLTRLRVNGALNSTATQIVVDSGDPSSTNLANRWGTANNLVPGDLLMVEPSADSATFTPEIIRVNTPTNATLAARATTFTAVRGQAGSTAAAIADNAFLLKIGSAFSEGTRSPSVIGRNPVKYVNYTQIFKTAYELTETARRTRVRTGKALNKNKKDAMFIHASSIELAILFGQAFEEANGEGGQPRRYMGGLREFVPNKVLSASWTLVNLIDMASEVFDWDSMAGDERMVFCGNGALNKFNQKIEAQNNAHQINFDGDKEMYGVRFRKYRVPQGDFYLKTHPLLSRHPLYNYSWFIVDGSQLKWCHMEGRDTKFMDNIQHNDEDTIKGQWLTEGTIQVDGGGLTMMYIGGFNL